MTEKFTASNGVVVGRYAQGLEARKGLHGVWLEPPYVDALREYFAAHPAQPWHDAKPGEHWMLTVEGVGREYVGILSEGHADRPDWVRFFPIADPPACTVGANAPIITEGRRIYPEPE